MFRRGYKNIAKVLVYSVSALCIFFIFAAFCNNIFAAGENYRQKRNNSTDDLRMFLKLRSRLQERISSEEKADIQFAFGEYYFKNKAYNEAKKTFTKYIIENPNNISSLLANVYLYKIAGIKKAKKKREAIKKEIFKEKFVLLFGEYKTLNYTSIFGNQYEIRYFVDKIEIYINDEIFEQINP